MAPVLCFHHIGLLTHQPDVAARRLRQAGYVAAESVFDPLQGATLQLCHAPDGAGIVELITPASDNSALRGLLKRRGDYMYHVCFEVPTLEEGTASLELDASDRLTVVIPPREAILFGNRRVAFYAASGLGLVELLER